ncbi:uncharacterized protein LOC111085582 [Limulus polyphemus]|uniref:Uncharacterized protein LOC111085582 n=1 Tax=Limulus polyphemus TaxID=6850 RepID=A0ABM1SA74_LIMPO|nr:uncharacterized protein LOC111085582 [Limulus polyphemus]
MEKEIQTYEKRHIMENYQVKTEQLEKLEKKVQELEETQKELEQQAAALHAALDPDDNNDQISVKQFLMEKADSGHELSKEQEDFVDALNRQEIIKRELDSTTQQRDVLKEEVDGLAEKGDKLQKLYEERDELLDNIFGGEYGSELENSLEKEVDLLHEQKKHVDQAHFKWTQAHMMVKQAISQLGLSLQKWKEMSDISPDEFEQRYSCAAETRNNLVAAIQNLQGAQRYLPNVVFPYCSEEEVDTLEKAVSNIFTDIQTEERQEHALACYDTTYRRSSALRQWFEQVLNTTIARDLARITETCKTKTLELRQERIRLIRKKVKEMTGKDVDVDPVMASDADDASDDAAADEQVAQLFEADNAEEQDNSLSPGPQMPPAPTPVPINELAPPPSNEEIFVPDGYLHRKRITHHKLSWSTIDVTSNVIKWMLNGAIIQPLRIFGLFSRNGGIIKVLNASYTGECGKLVGPEICDQKSECYPHRRDISLNAAP